MRMKAMPIGIFMSVVGMIVLGFLGKAPAVELHQPSADARQRLVLAPAQRDMILVEMRLMLTSVSGIVRGLAIGDLSAAEKAARASGMGGAADVNPHIKPLLPQQFLELGMQTHMSLSRKPPFML